MHTTQIRRLKAFGQQVWDDSQRDLGLLRAIEVTLDKIDIDQERVQQLNNAALLFLDGIGRIDTRIDQNDVLVPLFDKARDSVAKSYQELVACHKSAVNDHNLRDDDGIVEGFASLMAITAELHNNLNKLSWAIGEHDADFDEVLPGSYDNAEDLFKVMGV